MKRPKPRPRRYPWPAAFLLGGLIASGCNDGREKGSTGGRTSLSPAGPAIEDASTAIPPGPAPGDEGGLPTPPFGRGGLETAGLDLPFSGSTSSTDPAFRVTQTGSGGAGFFEISGFDGSADALVAHAEGEGHALRALNEGLGRGIWGQINNPSNPSPAILGTTNGRGNAIHGLNVGRGSAGFFEVRNPSNESDAVRVESNGRGDAFFALSTGTGFAGKFAIKNPASSSVALRVTSDATSGIPEALRVLVTGDGRAGAFRIRNNGSTRPGLYVESDGRAEALRVHTTGRGGAGLFLVGSGPGDALVASTNSGHEDSDALAVSSSGTGTVGKFVHRGTSGEVLWVERETSATSPLVRVISGDEVGNFAVFEVGSTHKIRFDKTGKGFFEGGTSTGGADLAETFEVVGPRAAYEPGDVLEISTERDRAVEKSSGPYSTRVIGVYATRPGVLLGGTRDGSGSGRVPVAVTGVVPTKVSVQNGPIRRGDLLVSASRPGYAMRAPDALVREARIPHGAIVGKALEAFQGPGAGTILVMVDVQ